MSVVYRFNEEGEVISRTVDPNPPDVVLVKSVRIDRNTSGFFGFLGDLTVTMLVAGDKVVDMEIHANRAINYKDLQKLKTSKLEAAAIARARNLDPLTLSISTGGG